MQCVLGKGDGSDLCLQEELRVSLYMGVGLCAQECVCACPSLGVLCLCSSELGPGCG